MLENMWESAFGIPRKWKQVSELDRLVFPDNDFRIDILFMNLMHEFSASSLRKTERKLM